MIFMAENDQKDGLAWEASYIVYETRILNLRKTLWQPLEKLLCRLSF